MQMSCIMMHSDYDAFMCIKSYSTARFGCIARAIWMHDTCFMIDCIMRENAYKYPNMRENAHECAGLVDHTYIHKRRRVDSRLDSHGSIAKLTSRRPRRSRSSCGFAPSTSTIHMDTIDPARSPRARACCATHAHPQLGLGLGRAATRGEELARLAIARNSFMYAYECVMMR